MAAPSRPSRPAVRVDTSAVLDLLVLTCRDGDCLAQWSPTPVQRDGSEGPAVIALSVEVCPVCGSSVWEVTEVQVASSPSAGTRRSGGSARRSHRSSHSGRGF